MFSLHTEWLAKLYLCSSFLYNLPPVILLFLYHRLVLFSGVCLLVPYISNYSSSQPYHLSHSPSRLLLYYLPPTAIVPLPPPLGSTWHVPPPRLGTPEPFSGLGTCCGQPLKSAERWECLLSTEASRASSARRSLPSARAV